MPLIIRHIPISVIVKYGKACTLGLMKYGNCLIAFDHPGASFGGGLVILTSSPTRGSLTPELLLLSIQVVVLVSHVITSSFVLLAPSLITSQFSALNSI